MKIDISGITRVNGASGDVAFDGIIKDLNSLEKDFKFGPADFRGKIVNTLGILKLSGRLKVNYTAECYRCLKTLEGKLNINIAEDFINSEDNKNSEVNNGSEFKKDNEVNRDSEAYTYSGNSLDIEKALKDNIILELPMKQLCSLDCKGLCSKCGIDLNNGTCSCMVVTEDSEESIIDTINPDMAVLRKFYKN